MPVVPTDQNRVQGTGLPSVRSTVDYSPDAFGAGVGRALQSVAGNVAVIAEQEQQKQDTAVLMGAERELQDWQNQQLFAPQTGAYAQRGKSAFGLTDRIMPEYDKIYAGIESRLNNRQKALFQQRTGAMRGDMERGLMRHIGQEADSYRKSEGAAYVATQLDTAQLYANDPQKFDVYVRKAQDGWIGANPGAGPDEMKYELGRIESQGRSQLVQKLLADGNTVAAKEYFDRYRDVFTVADATRIEAVLRPAWVDEQGRLAVDAVDAGRAVAAPSDYATFRRALESDGRADAKNPDSSAYGADQFTAGTWMDMVEKEKPAWAEGLSRDEILAMRADPEKSGEMAEALDRDNASALTNAGQDVTNQNLYAAHHFGAGVGVKFARASGDTPMSDIITPSQMAANGYLRGMTKAEAIANWNKRAGVASSASIASPESAAAGMSVPSTRAQRLEMLNSIANPDIRKAALAEESRRHTIAEIRKADQTEAITESINSKVEAADPSLSLRQVLTPEEYAWASAEGKVAAWEARLQQRIGGTEPKTDPVLFDALQTTLMRAENGDPVAIGEVRKLDPTSLFTKLDRQAREYVQNRRSAIMGALAKSKDAEPDFASEDELLNTEVFDKLGISKNPNKNDSDEVKATRTQFMQSYWSATQTKQRELGRKLNSSERQQIMRELLLPFSRTIQKDWWFDSTETKRRFQIGEVPPLDRQQIVEAFRERGMTPTDAQITAMYLRKQGFAPQMENQ